jgi:hypothetical protein
MPSKFNFFMSFEGETKEEVKTEADFINIIVKSNETEVHFKIKRSTPLKKLMNSFAQRQGKDPKAFKFTYDGETVLETSYLYSNQERQRICRWRMAI